MRQRRITKILLLTSILICLNFLNAVASTDQTACGVEGQSIVLDGSIYQEPAGEPIYDKSYTNYAIGSGSPQVVRDFINNHEGERVNRNELHASGIPYCKTIAMFLSKWDYQMKYEAKEIDYVQQIYSAWKENVDRAFSPFASSATSFATAYGEYSDYNKKVDLKHSFDGIGVDYRILMSNVKSTANEYATVVSPTLNVLLDASNSMDYWDYNIVPQSQIQIFPDAYQDLVYVSKQDYTKLCPWYEEYQWVNGETNGWRGSEEKASEIANSYINSPMITKSYVNNIWKSLSGSEHEFLRGDIVSSRLRDPKYSYLWPSLVMSARYNANVGGTLEDLLETTKLPSGVRKEKRKDSYVNNKEKEIKYYYYEVGIEEEEQMSSNWQISSDGKTWMTVASNVKGVRECSYNVLDDAIKIGETSYSVQDAIGNHGRVFYVRRMSTCGNVFWTGTVTSPALRVRPFLSLDSLDVYTNKEVVEGSYLDPKDIVVIAHYNTGDVVMSGNGSYIKYPGNANLRVTKVGTNYAYYEYTDPQLGDVITGYFQIKGIERTPVSITAEYVGGAVAEKTDYVKGDLRVHVTFNNGSASTYTAESSNIGVYKTKFYGKGDMDLNGVLNDSDVTLLREFIAGGSATSQQRAQADVNGDGKIDMDDVEALKAVISRKVELVGSNTFYAAVHGLKMSDGSPVYARFQVEGVRRVPYSLSVVSAPDKTVYIEGEEFNPEGLVLKVLYDNGEYTYINYTSKYDYFENVTFGDQERDAYNLSAECSSIPVFYTESGVTVDTEIPIDISLRTLTSIKVTRPPDEMIYYSGENLITTGMEVTAYFDEGVEGHSPDEVVLSATEYTLSGNKKMADSSRNIVFQLDHPENEPKEQGGYLVIAKDLLEDGQELEDQYHGSYYAKDGSVISGMVCGNHLVKVTYTNRGTTKDAYQPVYVYNKRPVALTIVSMPYKTEYVTGQSFQRDGLVLRVSYSDGTSAYLYPQSEGSEGYSILDGDNLTSDRGYVVAQYTENVTTLQVEIPILVRDPNIDGITASYVGPAVYVGTQFDPKDVQIIVSYTDGNVSTFRADETNADGTKRVKIVQPTEDGDVNPEAVPTYTVSEVGDNTFAACYAGYVDLFEVRGLGNPSQLDFTGSIAKTKRMYDTWTEMFTATKIRSVADYIKGRVELADVQTVDEYHVVNEQKTTDTRTSLSFEEGTGQGVNLADGGLVSPLLSFLREGAWRQPETVISVAYQTRTNGFLYPETTNPLFASANDGDLVYQAAHNQTYGTSRSELQSYTDEGWSDWVENGDTAGTVLADREAYNYTGTGSDPAAETMVLDRIRIKLLNVPEGSSPRLKVTCAGIGGAEMYYDGITEDDVLINPCQIKIELDGMINVVDNYGVEVSKPFADVYQIFYRTTTEDSSAWSSAGDWAGYANVPMQCLEIHLLLKENEFNTGTTTSAPVLNKQPRNVSAKIGSNATFSVSAVGNDLIYQWYVNGTAIPDATSQVYVTPELELSNSGDVYYCVVTADFGSGAVTTSSSATLTVRDMSPVLTTDLNSQHVGKVGDEVNFHIEAQCLDPSGLHYEWQITKNGSYVPLGSEDEPYLNLVLDASMHGEYIRCHVTNSQGACNSNPCLIRCNTAPEVTIRSSESSVYISSSGTGIVTFYADVASDVPGAKTYSWAVDGVRRSSVTGDTMTWAPINNGAHEISCTVTDSIGGSGTGVLDVYVGSKPTVTLTAEKRNEPDGTVTLTITANVTSYDAAGLSYTWSYDGIKVASGGDVAISGDQKTLTIKNAVGGNHAVGLQLQDHFGSASALQAIVVN